jgi:VCBS repeat-containing protein
LGLNHPETTSPTSISTTSRTAPWEDSGVFSVDLLAGATDADGDALHVANVVTIAGATLNGDTLEGDTGSAAFQSLASGISQQFVVNYDVIDGHGGAVHQTATITIVGVNDLPSITGEASGTVTEDGQLTATGKLTCVDVDQHPIINESGFGEGIYNGAYGDLAMAVDGNWTYTLNNALPAVQALNAGQTLSDTITVYIPDGSVSPSIRITINGVNEAPQLPLVNVVAGTNRGEVIDGTAAADLITPYGGADVVRAGGGNDTIKATINDGADFYDGGPGIDTVDYSALTKAVTVNLTQFGGLATGAQAGIDALVSIENVIGSQAGDQIVGNKLANVITGGPGNDRLTGNAGNDTFVFERPADGVHVITDFTRGQDIPRIWACRGYAGTSQYGCRCHVGVQSGQWRFPF